jgi:hypothetical protein
MFSFRQIDISKNENSFGNLEPIKEKNEICFEEIINEVTFESSLLNDAELNKNKLNDICLEKVTENNITEQISNESPKLILTENQRENDTLIIDNKKSNLINFENIIFYKEYFTKYQAIQSYVQEKPMSYPIVFFPKYETPVKPPLKGKNGLVGHSEKIFFQKLKQYFDINIYNDLSLRIIDKINEPDFVFLFVENKGIVIDIEIDEPYDGIERKPIHYKTEDGTTDDYRNTEFIERGWLVVRFAEIQVVQNPDACCLFLYKLIAELDSTVSLNQKFEKDLELNKQLIWTKDEAIQMAIDKERERYLGIDKFIEYQSSSSFIDISITDEENRIEELIMQSKIDNKQSSDIAPMSAREKLAILKRKNNVNSINKFQFRISGHNEYDGNFIFSVVFINPIPKVKSSHKDFSNLFLENVKEATIREEILDKLIVDENFIYDDVSEICSYEGTKFVLDIPKPKTRWDPSSKRQVVVPISCVITDKRLSDFSGEKKVEYWRSGNELKRNKYGK